MSEVKPVMTVLPATRIDTHHHVVPGFYRDWLVSHGVESGGMPMPAWSVDGSREVMRSLAVRTAMLSVSTPGVDPWPAADAAAIARDLNDFARPGDVLFGSDYPFAAPWIGRSFSAMLRAYPKLSGRSINLGAAERLFPRLAR